MQSGMKKVIAVVSGGYSKEAVISVQSAEMIIEAIDKNRFDTHLVVINSTEWYVKKGETKIRIDKNNFSFRLSDTEITFDAVFMAIHGAPGEDGKLQSYFEMLHIPVTTCDSFVSALTFNKYACKTFLKDFDVLSAKARLIRKNDEINAADLVAYLGLPMFVKPNNGGSSFGVTKVKSTNQVIPAIEKALQEDTEIILEEYIEGREFTCGVFCSDTENYVLPVTEIVSKSEFFDFDAKYNGESDEITPARLNPDQTRECQKLTFKIYKFLRCHGVVRIDFLLKNGQFYFIEANTVPGMSKESIVPQQIRAMDMQVGEFFTLVIEDAINRNKKQA